MNILVSACLLGVACRYDGASKGLPDGVLRELMARHTLVPACPEQLGCTAALLKQRSPSCGCGEIYDGTFTGTLTPGDGVTAALLSAHGVRVYGEDDVAELLNL